jgi:hypothetical protein
MLTLRTFDLAGERERRLWRGLRGDDRPRSGAVLRFGGGPAHVAHGPAVRQRRPPAAPADGPRCPHAQREAGCIRSLPGRPTVSHSRHLPFWPCVSCQSVSPFRGGSPYIPRKESSRIRLLLDVRVSRSLLLNFQKELLVLLHVHLTLPSSRQ